jgi:hypothetical protein
MRFVPYPPVQSTLLVIIHFSWTNTISHYRPMKIPLSAFVVEDMMEFVQAHASYRFVIRDEEEERPRMLVCLLLASTHFIVG